MLTEFVAKDWSLFVLSFLSNYRKSANNTNSFDDYSFLKCGFEIHASKPDQFSGLGREGAGAYRPRA